MIKLTANRLSLLTICSRRWVWYKPILNSVITTTAECITARGNKAPTLSAATSSGFISV